MAKIRGALSSKGVNLSTTFSKLGGSALSGLSVSSGSGVRPYTLDPNSGSVRYTNMPVPNILPSTALSSAAGATNTVVDAAFRYQERKENLQADKGVLDYSKLMRNKFYGDGDKIDGYGNSELQGAIDGFQGHMSDIDSTTKDFLMQYPESVRVKMAMRVNQERQVAKERAVNHNLQEFKKAEIQTRTAENQAIKDDIYERGTKVFYEGKVQDHLSRYKNAAERQAAEEEIVKQAVFSEYNKALDSAYNNTEDFTPQVTAYNASEKALRGIEESLSGETRTTIDHWMLQRKSEAVNVSEKIQAKRLQKRKDEIDAQAAPNIASSILRGNYDTVVSDIEEYSKLYADDPSKASKKISDALKGSLAIVANQTGGTFYDKQEAVANAFSSIQDADKNGSIGYLERLELENHINGTLIPALERKQNTQDHDSLAKLQLGLRKAHKDGKQVPVVNPPINMLEQNQVKWYKFIDNHNEAIDKGIDGMTAKERDYLFSRYSNIVKDRALTDSEIRKLSDEASNNASFAQQFDKILEASNKLKKNPDDKPAYRKTNEYKGMMDFISQVSKFKFHDKPIRKNYPSEEEYITASTNFSYDQQIFESKAKDAFDLWAASKFDTKYGSSLDSATWKKQWFETEIRPNVPLTNPSTMKSIFGTIFSPPDNSTTRKGRRAAPNTGGFTFDWWEDEITGNGSIMAGRRR